MRVERTLSIGAAPELTWAFLRSCQSVARCLPGAELQDERGDDLYGGTIAFKVGPKVVTFSGTAQFRYDDALKLGSIEAIGADRRETSRARATVEFSVEPAPDLPGSTLRVIGDVTFAGALAQFANEGGLHVAEELFDQFRSNLADEIPGTDVAGRADLGTSGVSGVSAAGLAPAPPVKVGARMQGRIAVAMARSVTGWLRRALHRMTSRQAMANDAAQREGSKA